LTFFPIVNSVKIIAGQSYITNTIGTTDFIRFGASNNLVGTLFTATISGFTNITGTGTVTGCGAVLYPYVSNIDGSVYTVKVISGGSGYSDDTTISITGTGTGSFPNNLTAKFTPIINAGVINYISIVDPGKNYNIDNTTLVVQSDSGKDAHVSAIVREGQIVDVIIDNPGYGYRDATISAVGNSSLDIPASFTVSTSGGELSTIQANVELLAIDGTIDFIKVIDQGSGYTTATISITGDGIGALATAKIDRGNLVQIIITNRGSGYTYANIAISGFGTYAPITASARAIISPKNGHGNNALHELNVKKLMFHSTITEDSSGQFTFNNDFRQFGILKNPCVFDSRLGFYIVNGTACYTIKGITTNGILATDDQLLDNNGNSFTVVAISADSLLIQSNNNAVLTSGQQLTKGLISYLISSVTNPTIDKYSGDMLYIDNRAAFFQTSEQTVTFQTVLQF
jgi:hypothetical protein